MEPTSLNSAGADFKPKRLDLPVERGPWAILQRFKSPEQRRNTFLRLFNSTGDGMAFGQRTGRMRLLIDLGLWEGPLTQQARNDRDMLGHDALRTIRDGHLDNILLHLALEAGVDPNHRHGNSYDDSLLLAVARTLDEPNLSTLLECGANPRLRDSCRQTAFHLLVEQMSKGDAKSKAIARRMAERMLEAGVDPNDPGIARFEDPDHDITEAARLPIEHAIEKGSSATLGWLIERGARLDVVDGHGETPMHWMAQTTGLDPSERETLLGLLRQHGAVLDATNPRGETPAWTALEWRNLRIAEWLIECGVKMDVGPSIYRDPQGYEKPELPALTYLQQLIRSGPLNDRTMVLYQHILQNDPEAWQAPTADGISVEEWAQRTRPQWYSRALLERLEANTPATTGPSRKGPRL